MAGKNEGKATYGKSPEKKKPSSKKPAGRDTGGYDWGDGNKVHSVSRAAHDANARAKAAYGINAGTPLDAPLTTAQAYGMAEATANRTFAPQLQANQQLQTNTPVWYENYIARTGEQQRAAQAQAQPYLDTAQAAVGNAAQTTPGLDPSSAQYATDEQAAKGRETMAQDSANYLAGVAAATNAYFGGQANVAQRELPQVQAGLLSQYGQLATQRQDAVSQAYGDIRTNEQNASIARDTLGLNTVKAASDAQYDQQTLDAKAQEKKDKAKASGETPNKYGIPAAQWNQWSSSHRQRVIDAFDKKNGSSDKSAKDVEKKRAAIKASTGKVKVDVQNVVNKWNSYVGQQTDDTSKPKDPKTGEYPARNLTPSDIKRILGQKTDAGMIHVALLVKVGKPLDQEAIDYLHSKDPNIRIPREWLKGRQGAKTINRPAAQVAPEKAPAGYGQARPT